MADVLMTLHAEQGKLVLVSLNLTRPKLTSDTVNDATSKMKLWIVLALVSLVWASVPPPQDTYRILFLLPVTTKSHRNIHMALAKALADRGHKITMLTNHPPVAKHPNIHEFTHGLQGFQDEDFDLFEVRKEPDGVLELIAEIMHDVASKLYKVPEVMDLYRRRKEFDLMVVDNLFNEVIYPFVHEVPYITISGMGVGEVQSGLLGNVISPAYSPFLYADFSHPMTFLQRVMNIFMVAQDAFLYRHRYVTAIVQAEISKIFPDVPPLTELERNVSLTLINSHYSIDTTYPLLPSQIEIGAIHCKPAKPLPENLAKWIEGAEHGVIYFSLGSVVRGDTLPPEYRDVFVQAFARMKQRVIWKFEKDLEGISDNVLISKWLPQQDILAHPNVKVFITHGGLLSSQETVYHHTPVVALPVIDDQPRVAAKMEKAGFGRTLVWEELNVDLLVSTLSEVMNNPTYTEKIKTASYFLRDQKETPLDRAIWWTEYAIRNRGAPAHQCPGADLSWVEYLCLDVLLLLHVLVYLTYRVVKKVICVLFCSEKKEKKD